MGELDQVPRGAVAVIQRHHLAVWMPLAEAQQTANVGASPGVDGVVNDNPICDVVVQVLDVEVVDDLRLGLSLDSNDLVFDNTFAVEDRDDHGRVQVRRGLKGELA